MSIVDVKELAAKCKSTIERFEKEVKKMRSGRAHPGILESVQVDYFGSMVPLKQLALISVPESRILAIQPYDAQSAPAIEKAIQLSDLGLNPARDGDIIRVTIPALNEQRRKDLIRSLHKTAEDFRVQIRAHRRESIDILKSLQKKKEITEDDLRRGQDEVQKVTDTQIKVIDKILQDKDKEMSEI